MPTNFPSSLDSLTNPVSTDGLDAPPHSSQHADANDALEAVQVKIGVDGSGVTTSLDYLLKQGTDPGHGHSAYAASGHNHDAAYVNETDHNKAAHDALGIDAETIDGIDSAALAQLGATQTVTGPWTFNAGAFLDKGNLVYNVKGYGAVGDDSTDDKAAIQNAIDAAIAAGGGTVAFPEATYRITGGLNLDGASNLVLQGMGRATIHAVVASPVTGEAIFYTTDPNQFGGALTYYDLTGTHNRGDSVLNFATAAEAGNFSVGDYIWVRTRQTINGSTEQPIAELNRVRASDDVAGTVTLDWPLAKEYTDDGVNPYGVAVTTGVHVNNAIRGLRLVSSDIRTTNLHQQINHVVEDCEWVGVSGFLPHGRFITIRNCRGHLDPAWGTFDPRYVLLDRGTCDVIMQGNYWSSEGMGGLHIHEGVANVTCYGNTYHQAASDGEATSNVPVISIRATAWDIRLIGEVIVNSPLAQAILVNDSSEYPGVGLGSNGVLVQGVTVIGSVANDIISFDSGANGQIIGNRLLATASNHALDIQDAAVVVAGNDLGSNTANIVAGAVLGRNRGAADMLDQANTWSAEQTFNGNNFAETDKANTWSALQTLADAVNIALGTTTGTQIGTAATQKLGFFGATPVAQQSSTVDLKDLLVALGFLPDGGATPLNLDNGLLTSGYLRARTGSEAVPGLGFAGGDNDTGFYSPTGDQIGISTGGATRMEFNSTGLISIPTLGTWHFRFNGGTGQLEFADGAGGVSDTNLYRSAANVLKTDDSLHVAADLSHLGSNAGFFGATPTTKPTALTAADASTVDATYGQAEADVINNLRTRLGELETKLQSLGLLA